jgi:tetratricopeptide (TPR) repeat protein
MKASNSIDRAYKYVVFCTLISLTCSLHAQCNKIDSLLLALENANQDSTKVNTLANLCWEYRLCGDLAKSKAYGEKGISLGEESEYIEGQVLCYNNVGVLFKDKSQFDSALIMFDKGMDLVQILLDSDDSEVIRKGKLYKAKLLGNYGVVYLQLGNFTKALDYYFECLKIFEQLNDRFKIAQTYSNIGDVYKIWNDNSKALEYYNKAVVMQEGDLVNLATTQNMLAVIYRREGNYVLALHYLRSSLHIRDSLGIKQGIALSLSSIGFFYQKLPDSACQSINITPETKYDSALVYHFKSLKIFEEIENKRGAANVLGFIADICLAKNDIENALTYLIQADELAKEIEDIKLQKDVQKSFYRVYKKKGDSEKALQHFELYFVLHDSIFKSDNRVKIAVTELTYQFDKKQSDLNLEIERQKRNTGIVLYVSIPVGICAILFALLYFQQRNFSNELLNIKDKLDNEAQVLVKRMTNFRLKNQALESAHLTNKEKHQLMTDGISTFSKKLKDRIRLIGRMIKIGDFKEVTKIRSEIKKDFESLNSKIRNEHSFLSMNEGEIEKAETSIGVLLEHLEKLMEREPTMHHRMRIRLFTLTTFYIIALLVCILFTISYGWDAMSPWIALCTAIVGLIQILISIPFKGRVISIKKIN